MSEAFDAKAQAVYEAEGRNPGEDLAKGLLLEECFVLDFDGVRAVGAAAGGGAPAFKIADSSYLSGVPGEDETLNCQLRSTGVQMAVFAGSTPVDADGQLDRLLGEAESFKDFEGTAPGLDAGDVAAASAQGVTLLVWVTDGFVVGVSGTKAQLGGEAGFAILGAAVAGVARTLQVD